jgi:hypothetical protein
MHSVTTHKLIAVESESDFHSTAAPIEPENFFTGLRSAWLAFLRSIELLHATFQTVCFTVHVLLSCDDERSSIKKQQVHLLV